MKKVKMNVSISSSEDWSYHPGQVVTIEDKLAEAWSVAGHCEILETIAETNADQQRDTELPEPDAVLPDETNVEPITPEGTTESTSEPVQATKKRGAKNGNQSTGA